jgi:hypothetical protein
MRTVYFEEPDTLINHLLQRKSQHHFLQRIQLYIYLIQQFLVACFENTSMNESKPHQELKKSSEIQLVLANLFFVVVKLR